MMENKDYLNGCLDENSLDDLAEAFDAGLNENDDLLVRSFFADNRIDIADCIQYVVQLINEKQIDVVCLLRPCVSTAFGR